MNVEPNVEIEQGDILVKRRKGGLAMESLERLREFVGKGSRTQITTLPPIDMVTLDWRDLAKLIDDIEDDFLSQRNLAWNDGYDAGFASADDWCADHEKVMAEHGWYRVLDADDVPIRVGDVLEGEKIGGGFCEPFEVVGYIMSNGELEPMDKHKLPRRRKYSHHHHTPTVEDVLREFAHVGIHIGAKDGLVAGEFDFYADEDSIAKYAARLRLAGDGE